MDTCIICGGNAVISECKTCLIKCCKSCDERHKDSCNMLKEIKYHRCRFHVELVKAYCCNCYQLICKECIIDNHHGHNYIRLFEAYHNREGIVNELSLKQTTVRSYIDACKETRQKYSLLQAHIGEEEQTFQRCISFVKESLMQQVEPNIKQINDLCKAGEEVLDLQEISPEDARQSQKFPLIYLAQLSNDRNGLNVFEQQYMSCDILVSADQLIQQSRDGLHQDFLSKVIETASTCDKDNGTNDNRMEIDPIVHIPPTIQDMADQSFPRNPQQQTTHTDSDGVLMNKLEEMSTALGERERERVLILEFLQSLPSTVDKIACMTQVDNTTLHFSRDDNITIARFQEGMEHVFKSMIQIKNQLIQTKQDLKNKIHGIADWTNNQAQSEIKEIQLHQGIVDDKNRQLNESEERIKKLETLNNDLQREKQELQTQLYMEQNEQQCLPGKTKLKKIETEYNQLKQENAKLHQEKQHDAEQNHQLCKEKKDLLEGLKTAEEIINESQKKMTDLENEVLGLRVTVGKKEHAIKSLRAEKDDCLNRLSSMAGDKLTKGNPAITDLGDPNRPMKIAEKYGELYDNEWTDSMEYSVDAMRTLFPAVDHQLFDEILVYHLHRLVMCCYRECLNLSTEQEQTIRSAVIDAMKLQIEEDETDVNNMPGYREIFNLRKQNAQQFANTLFQNKMISMISIITDWDYTYKNEELIGQLLESPFFEKCVHLSWYMSIQDPVMYLAEEIKPDTVYNRDVYKEFVQSGDKVKYVVWPALFLHKGGPLLYKGVVQAYK